MYSVSVRNHVMIAHSFRGELFGPAQRLHGATYVVDVEFRRAELGPEGVVVDIARATQAVEGALAEINFRNLDELAEFSGKNTTTEFLARWLFERLSGCIAKRELGPGSEALSSLRVTFNESHVASASYEQALSS
ncbi:MAG TPA: 6-carboxytetrahydropterin synthase [Polyangiaceae bacterium]|nr:6-carboxytetrahydropterin synthase [Polyangiaceae bacterium]